MALVNGGFFHYTDLKKFLKSLPRNCRSDFEIILQESGSDISRRPDCLIQAVIAMGKLPPPFVSPPGKESFQVVIADTGSFWSLRPDRQMDIKLFTEFLFSSPEHNMLKGSF